MKDDFDAIEVNEESFPWIRGRATAGAKPTYKIISRSMTKSYNSIVMIHKAGTGYVKNYYMKELLKDQEMLKNMAPDEVKLIRWIIQTEETDPLEDIKKGRQKLES